MRTAAPSSTASSDTPDAPAERSAPAGARQFLAEHAAKQLLRLVVVGSVDDGKSSLIGRMLYECDALFEDQVAAVRRATARRSQAQADGRGAGSEAAGQLAEGLKEVAALGAEGELDFSLFTDGLKAEREQGITIDVAYRYFSTPRRKVIVADTPGHLQYTRNMATGASTADAAIILVDARLGVLPQTRRHAYIAALLGIPYLAVAVNKMDLVGFSPQAFLAIAEELGEFATALGFREVRLFPVSARTGDNITRAGPGTPWHTGGTLLAWLESLPHAPREEHAPFRFPVQTVLRPHLDYRGVAGQVASGGVAVGDEVVVLPSGRRTRIAGIDTFDGPLQRADAPASVTLRLADEVDVSRGDLLAPPLEAPRALQQVEADLVWFAEAPLACGRRYLVKHTTRTVPAQVDRVLFREELEDLSERPAETLALNDIGRVRLTLKRPLLVDAYRDNRRTGAFIVIDPQTNDTVAAGMLRGPAEGADASGGAALPSLVTREERRARLGQDGQVLLLAHGGRDAARQAVALERRLFDGGRHVAVVHGDAEAAAALAEAGLLALLVAPSAQGQRALQAALRESGARWQTLPADEPLEACAARLLATSGVQP
jgi:bifunctional enzyme CysN/CysC/sulfate adenylyltransferase subunit 1